MDPINYSTDISGAFLAPLEGYKNGLAISEIQAKQAQAIADKQAREQMQADLVALANNPNATGREYSSMMVKYPSLSEHFKRGLDALNGAQQQEKLTQASQVYSAIQSGKPEIATQLLNDHAKALRNSGNEAEAKSAETMAKWIESDPGSAKTTTALMLSAALGPDKFATAFPALAKENRDTEQAPADLRKKNADASKAATEAAIAAGTVPAQLVKPGLENEKTAQEIAASKSKEKIDALNVQIAQADSETKRGQLTLERDKLIAEQDLKKQAVGADAQNQADTIATSIAAIKALRNDPLIDSAFGVGTTTGKLLGFIPGTENKDFRAKVATLQAQQFLTQAASLKGMGALSDAEGARLEKAVASLDADQSKGAFLNSLGVIQSTLERGYAKLIAGGKLPQANGAVVMKHPVLGIIRESDINKIMVKNPGATREQVMQYLNSKPSDNIPK